MLGHQLLQSHGHHDRGIDPRGLGRRRGRGVPLSDLGPIEQLRAGRLPWRLVQLLVGLYLYGASLALMVRGQLGLAPWDVLHSGFIQHVPITLGQGVILFSFVALAFFLLGLLPMWLVHRAFRWRTAKRLAAMENSLRATSIAPAPVHAPVTTAEPLPPV